MLVRAHLFDDMSSIFRGFDHMLRDLGHESAFLDTPRLLTSGESTSAAPPRRSASYWSYPAVESFQRNGALVLRAELPGVDPKDVEIQVADGRLFLRGEKKEQREEKEATYYLKETFQGRFERTFTLPEGVQADEVKATYKDGVLEVSIPAPKAQETTRKVPIQVSGD